MVGDSEQCLDVCKRHFFKEGAKLKSFGGLFRANLRRIKNLAVLNLALENKKNNIGTMLKDAIAQVTLAEEFFREELERSEEDEVVMQYGSALCKL